MIDPILALALMALSASLYIVGWIILILGYNWLKKNNHSKTSFTKRGVWFAILLLVATTISRFVAGRTGYLEQGLLPWPEELVNSFMHALQSFTLDESYTDYLVKGAEGVEALWPHTGFSTVNSIYTTILNISCAITSQVALVAVIARVFPRVKLFLVSLRFWKCICYFSELNLESISLAKSIRNSDRKERKALFVFCSADPESDNISSECIEQARELGATLTRISLGDLKLTRRIGKKTFFLMGKDDDNLAILSGFAEEERVARLKESDAIYVFANDNYGTLIEKKVRNEIYRALNNISEDEPLVPDKIKKKITLFSVNRYKSLVYNLLEHKPLFTALDENSKDLKIAIFGSGKIGTEMFLAAYWCGQMLRRELRITVVSAEEEESFRQRIDHLNEEIFLTSENYKDNNLLRIYEKREEIAKPYFNFEYVTSDVYHEDIDDILTKEERANGRLADFDYYVVALGADLKNMETAEHIGRVLSTRSLTTGYNRKVAVPIACAIWSDELSGKLADRGKRTIRGVELVPFGSLKSTYSYDTILLKGIAQRAESAKKLYENNIAQNKNDLKDDPYKYWANVTKAIHSSYKAECVMPGESDPEERANLFLGMCDILAMIRKIGEMIEKEENYSPEGCAEGLVMHQLNGDIRIKYDNLYEQLAERTRNLKANCDEISRYVFDCVAFIDRYQANEMTGEEAVMEIDRLMIPQSFHQLAWLEHRRWNAFMRTEGFACPRDPDGNPLLFDECKYLELKLHSCIIECAMEGVRSAMINTEVLDRGNDNDFLDVVSLRYKTDYKKYDYPDYEYTQVYDKKKLKKLKGK